MIKSTLSSSEWPRSTKLNTKRCAMILDKCMKLLISCCNLQNSIKISFYTLLIKKPILYRFKNTRDFTNTIRNYINLGIKYKKISHRKYSKGLNNTTCVIVHDFKLFLPYFTHYIVY